MPPEAATLAKPRPDRTHARIVFWLAALGGAGVMAEWLFGQLTGSNTTWDTWAVPVVGVSALGAALVLRLWPQHHQQAIMAVLLAGSLFSLGSLHVAARSHDVVSWQSLAVSVQFFPILYLAAFIALQRGAARISWAHYTAMVLLYLVDFGGITPHSPPATAPSVNPPQHIWLGALASNPAIILALYYISTLKGRLARTQQEHQESKERFLAMLSHEIRTPLQTMLGSIDLLAIKAKSPPEQRAVERVRTAATQLETHLRDVTELTRLENPAWQLKEEEVDLLALARELCEQFRPQAEARGLNLQLQINTQAVPEGAPSPSWAHLRTDGRRLRQVLGNLLSNALKYTPQGQVCLRLSAPGPAHPTAIEVEDTGIGIPPEQVERIFDPYVRLEDQRVGHEEGTGLGLAVVRLLCERLGLKLEVDSAAELGSTFRLQWPQA